MAVSRTMCFIKCLQQRQVLCWVTKTGQALPVHQETWLLQGSRSPLYNGILTIQGWFLSSGLGLVQTSILGIHFAITLKYSTL